MLVEFTVSNYLSFKDSVTLSMVASSNREFQNTHIFERQKLKLLKSAAVYGANASGKSNLCKAMAFMAHFIKTSSKDTQVGERIDVVPYLLNTSSQSRPCEFEMVFFVDDILYRYGFEINDLRVVKEWLYYVPKRAEKLLFERQYDQFRLSPEFLEGKEWVDHTRENALFLSVIAQWKGPISTKIVQWITKNFKVVSGLTVSTLESVEMLSNNKNKDKYREFLRAADFGIEDIDIETIDVSGEGSSWNSDLLNLLKSNRNVLSKINMLHKKYDDHNEMVSLEKFDLGKQESEGTRKLFAILGPIINAIQKQTTLVIDELDSNLHPNLTKKIIEIFHTGYNRSDSQLIFNTHDTNLLSNKIFRRDQVWFVEKDTYGSSHLYSLAEYKNVRSDEAYEKHYLKGKYGAIPFLGEFDFLLEDTGESSDG